jgi:hypothetical protein
MITPEEVDQTAARLRDALHAAADVMQVSPALAPRPARAGHRVRRLPGWVIPLAAAACVVLIVAASVFAARHFSGTGPAPVPSTSVPYYVTAPEAYQARDVQVRQTSSGKITESARVPAPAGWQVTGISAAADNSTFFVSTADVRANCPTNRFYRFSVSGSGKISGFDLVGPAMTGGISTMSVSPDGSRLAVAGATCVSSAHPNPVLKVQVGYLDTGSLRTWENSVTAAVPARASSLEDDDVLSWLSDGRTLALSYSWQPDAAGQGDQAVLELDTDSRGGSLQADSHMVWQQPKNCIMCVYGGQVSPDGTTLIATAARSAGAIPAKHMGTWDLQLQRISLASGRVESTILATTYSTVEMSPPWIDFWPDGSGQQLLVQAGAQFGRLQDGRLVRLPYPANQAMIAWLAGEKNAIDVRGGGLAGGVGQHLVIEGVGGDLRVVRLRDAEVT